MYDATYVLSCFPLRTVAFRGHGFSLLAPARGGVSCPQRAVLVGLPLYPLRGLQTRGTALSFVPSKTICCSHRTRKASAALHRTKKIGLYFRGVFAFCLRCKDYLIIN